MRVCAHKERAFRDHFQALFETKICSFAFICRIEENEKPLVL